MKRGKSSVTLGLIQTRCPVVPKDNLDKTIHRIEQAAGKGAQIICTQELFRSRYFCQTEDHENFKLAEKIPGPTTKRLQSVAKKLKVVIVASLFEQRAAGVYHNSAVVIDADGKLLGHYRKMHIPDDPSFQEKFYFTPGDTGFKAWDTRYARIGVLVCWDQWFPEAARLTAMQGAQILLYPTAIGWLQEEKEEFGEMQLESWETIQRSHAIANGCYVASVNRVGHEKRVGGDGIEFWGNSFVAGTSGEVLARASRNREQVLISKLDLDAIDETRTIWPFFRDRRIDSYGDLTKRMSD
ncbi:MAG: acyltransferase [Verrucomicrobiales bacterium]|nr:acyltransferase [Verrucomicrobiales bacterium]|tara:strand:+ start:2583 stop:3473 length:891 start_codon:yes stop_codon:yes gene_type:complete